MDGLHTFRLLPIRPDINPNPEARSRKSHRKSRLGCLNCKTRRLKCDERKPECVQCARRSLPCSFGLPDAVAAPQRTASTYTTKDILPAPIRYVTCTLRASSVTLMNDSLSRCGEATHRVVLRASDLELLNHFERQTSSTIADSTTQRVYRDELVKIAANHVYLMDAILAMALLHQHIMRSSPGAPPKELMIHWKRCLSGFATRLSQGVDGNDADAMLATATLVNGIAFAMVDHQPRSQVWPLTSGNCDLSWLYIQRGIRTVYEAVPLVRSDSALKQLFDGIDRFDDTETPVDATMNPLYRLLANLCTTPGSEKNPYRDALDVLAPLLDLECSPDTILRHLGFIGSMTTDFIALLRRKDHRALLILSYWYANICSFECWWVSARPMTECIAICEYLDRHADPGIRDLLYFPVKASGYSQVPPETHSTQTGLSGLTICAVM